MGFFKKKPDPISDRSKALNAQIASLEAQIKKLDVKVQKTAGQPRLRSTALPAGAPIPNTKRFRSLPREPVFESVDHRHLDSAPDNGSTPEHYNELGVRKYDLRAAWQRLRSHLRGPPANNPKLVSYLAAGSIRGLRPLRYEKEGGPAPLPCALPPARGLIVGHHFRLCPIPVTLMTQPTLEQVALRLREEDDVAVLKRALPAGTQLLSGSAVITVPRAIPAGHKIALTEITLGGSVRKYGQIIGFASQAISPGDHVHTHNLVMRDFERDYAIGTELKPTELYPESEIRTFEGFGRSGGRVGTRNYVAVISSVNCSASVSQYIADQFKGPEFRRDFPNVDGVVAFKHKSGCALEPGEPHAVLQRVLAGLARHPNIGGYVLIGLGCEVAQVHLLVERFHLDQTGPGETAPTFLTIQNQGGVRKTIEAGVAAVRKLLPQVDRCRRSKTAGE